jgi:purine nucleosidase
MTAPARVVSVIVGFGAVLSLIGLSPARAQPPAAKVIPVLVDTDIGSDIDDAFALGLALSSPELEIRGITTVHGDAYTRALIACRLLHALGRDEIPVASGRPPQEVPDLSGEFQYGLRPAFRKRPERELAVEFLYRQFKARPGELILLAIGPLTNVAELLRVHPDCKPWIKGIVLMGGALRVGYNNQPPVEAEWNIRSDISAAQAVFAAGLSLVVVPLDATTNLKLELPQRQRIFAAGTALTNQLHALYQLGDTPTPTLFDPVAAAVCFEDGFCRLEPLRLEVDAQGITRMIKGQPNARVATAIQREEFLHWFVERLAPASRTPAKLPGLLRTNVAAPVAQGNLPNAVHVIEDFETDIERRWWLCGKLETKNVPPGSRRACRGVLTNDFDDRMGNLKAMYSAVIFNPVPGPPMGKNTRLSFRYWVKGSDALRVQIYSLTNGYHRHLTLTELPQGQWTAVTVNMAQARRPDGSGGPLGENERIDDVQFYADPEAQLFIDDIILYDAAPPGERRLFPKRAVFTAWFDTGRQGKEWPGDFTIVPKKPPLTWKAAQSVPHPELGVPWIRLHLRGERPLGAATQLRFRYFLTATDAMQVSLVNSTAKTNHLRQLKGLKRNEWAEALVGFSSGSPQGPKTAPGERVDEIRFVISRDSQLLVDDVLLFEPGQ